MKKILILSNEHSYTYNFRKEIIQELLDNTYEVTVVVPYGKKVENLKEMGCNHINLPLDRRGINPITDLKLLFSYKKIIKNIKPNIVLSYTIKPNVYGGLACQFTKTPYIPNITGLGTAVENKGLLQKIAITMYKLGLKKSKTVFFQNEENMRIMQIYNIGKDNGRLIPGSGVNIETSKLEDYPNEEEKIKFIFIGRLMKAKGINELFSASEIIKKKYPQVEFHFIGGKEEDFSERIDFLEKNNIIKYYGHQNDVHKFIKESHAIIHPSYHEGMSNVLLEAATAGRPILATDISGCRETFDDGVSGFAFEAKNVEDLVKTIEKFIELPHERKKEMGIEGRRKMEREFDRSIIVNAYLEEIEKILGDAR